MILSSWLLDYHHHHFAQNAKITKCFCDETKCILICYLPCGLLYVGVFNLCQKQLNHIKGNRTLVLMHSGIVNGYQLLCDAHTVPEPHRGTACSFFSILFIVFFPLFLFMCLSLWQSFLWCLFSLCFSDRTAVCTHPWHGGLYNLSVQSVHKPY